MKAEVKAAVAQFDSSWMEPEESVRRMSEVIRREGARGVELISFPELVNTGYFSPTGTKDFDPGFRDRFWALAESIPGPTTETLSVAAAEHGVHVTVGLLERDGETIYNSMCLLGPEGVVGTYRKVHLPVAEKHYFTPGDEIEVFETPLGRIGMSICFDGRFPELSRTLALKGAEIICSGWAVLEWPGLIVKESQLHRAYTRAQENGLFYLAANRAGVEDKTTYTGHSAIAGPNGNILAYSETREEDLIEATLKEADLEEYRDLLNPLSDRRPELYGELVR